MATLYIDSSVAAGGDGSLTNPYNNIKELQASDLTGGGGNTINIAGRHYLYPLYTANEKFTGLKNGGSGNHNVYQQWAGKPQAEIVSGVRVDNNSNYKWLDPLGTGEYQLRSASDDGDTGIPIYNDESSATVDGYYRIANCKEANKKKEQMARHNTGSATESGCFIGSLEELEFGADFAQNVAGSDLAYQTFYFKPEEGKTPDDYEIIISTSNVNAGEAKAVLEISYNYQTFKNIHFLGGSEMGMVIKAIVDVENCIIANCDEASIYIDSTSNPINIKNCIFSQSHGAVRVAKDATVNIYNCVSHNQHLFVRVLSSGDSSVVTVKNCLVIGGESGAYDLDAAPTGGGSFTETNNCYYVRLNDSTNKLGYNSTHWAATDASSIPPSQSATAVIGSATAINKYKLTLIDPKVVAFDLHNYKKCDFHLQEDSVCIGAGINRNSDANVPLTDFEGVTYGNQTTGLSKPNINIGCYQTIGTGKGSSTPADNVLINYLTEETIAPAFVLNPGESAEIFCDPVLKKGEYIQGTEGGGSIGTVINEFSSFGKISNRKTSSQSYVLTKSLTKAPTRVSYE